MNQEKAVVLMLKGLLDEAPEDTKAKVKEAVAKLQEVVQSYGDEGKFALSLVAAEFAAE